MAVISKMTFDNGSTKNLIGSTFYGKCDTAAGTAAKTVTIGGWDESVKDNVSGATIHIYFTNGNTATNPTLNIDSGGAHPIYLEDDVKAAAFPAGVYSLTLVLFTISSQETWCWLMQAKTDWSYISNKPSLDFIPTTQKGANSGVATLDANGKVPSGQLPSYVDDVLEYTARSLFPSTGTSGIIYVDTSTNLTYRWSGSDYVEISPSLALGETESTAYRGDRGATAYAHATDSGRLTTATSAGLYKVSVTAQGHVGSAAAVTKSDITALGIPGDSGVTSVTIKGTSPITIDSESAITTTGTRTISLANSYGDTKNPYAAKVANTVLAGPASGNDAAPTFRQLVAADIPLLTKSKISDFPTSMPASDVSAWAKAATKPSYSLSEINGTDDLQEIEALTGTSGFLKKTAANVWTLDTNTYSNVPNKPTISGTYNLNINNGIASWVTDDDHILVMNGTLTGTTEDPITTTTSWTDYTTAITNHDRLLVIIPTNVGTGYFELEYKGTISNDPRTDVLVGGALIATSQPVEISFVPIVAIESNNLVVFQVNFDDFRTVVAKAIVASEANYAGTATFASTADYAERTGRADIATTAETATDFVGSSLLSNGTYSLNVNNGVQSWTAVAPSGLQPPSSNGHYMLGVNGSAVSWESSPDLYAIEQLSGTSGILKKTDANTWTLDTTTYLASSAISDWAKASTKPSYSLSEIDGTQDLRKIEALADSSTGFLKKTAANTWALDSTTYATSSDISSAINALDGSVTGSAAASKTLTSFSQTDGVVTATFSDISITKSQVSDFPSSMPASDVSSWAKASTKPSYALSELTDASDVQAIEALTGTSGFLKKTATDTWSLDTTSYLPTAGGNVTGDITLLKQVESGAPGDSYGLIFQRGTLTDNYNDWMIIDSGGYLYFRERGSGSTAWTNRVTFNTSGNVSAASFSGSGASLTSLNASNLSSGTVPVARIPDLSSTYIPTSEKGAASGVATLDTNSKVPIVQSNYLYGKCTTTGSTAAKTVTIAGYDESTIANMEGVTVFVAFKNVSTASNPTLNVNSAGAHPIVTGTYDDPVAIGKFTSGLHAFTLVKALDNSYYWYINEGRDTVPEAPTTTGTYLLTINSSGNVSWSTFTPPAAATTGTVTINASGWSGNGPYSHSVTISGTTANSKIDLQPDSTVLAQMTTDGTTALYIENNNGTLTAWAMGAAPTASLTIQYTKTEVA